MMKIEKSEPNAFYSIVGPGTLRSQSKYNIDVSIHKANEPCKIKVGVKGPSFEQSHVVDLNPHTTRSVEIDVPKLKQGNYLLFAEGLEGIKFENSKQLNLNLNRFLILFQTDKATYKPGDLVQFRVLFLDPNTRPATIDEPITILLKDKAGNRIKLWQDVKLTKGVFTSNFQLSEQPLLGQWSFEVSVNGEPLHDESFEIQEYELPKFDIVIETDKNVAVSDGVVKVTLRSKYTYGKPVKGRATITIQPSHQEFSFKSVDVHPKSKVERTVDMNGSASFEFHLGKDIHLVADGGYLPELILKAVIEENLTGNKKEATERIILQEDHYKIEGVDFPEYFIPEKPLSFKVVVKNLDDSPVQDKKNPVKLILDRRTNYNNNAKKRICEYESLLDEHGSATFELTIPSTIIEYTMYTMKAEFQEVSCELGYIRKYEPPKVEDNKEPIKLKVLTEKPQLKEKVSFEVSSNEEIRYFIYTLVGRGNILLTDYVHVPKGQKSHKAEFMTTFAMMPQVKLFVYFVMDGDLKFDEDTIRLEEKFENSVEISAAEEVKPGEEVQLQINTNPDSFVGLLGVDQSCLLLKSGNDLSKEKILRRLDNFESHTPYTGYQRFPGRDSGLITITNACHEIPCLVARNTCHLTYKKSGLLAFGAPMNNFACKTRMKRSVDVQKSVEIVLRKNFIESWIFDNIENVDGKTFKFSKNIPDTITSWIITGFSLNNKTGIALTDSPTKIKTFRPFFVSTNLPYSVKRGEDFAVPVLLFNYTDMDLKSEVTFDNDDDEFDFIDDEDKSKMKRVKNLTIPSNSGDTITFKIRPKKLGHITLKLTARSPIAGDAIHKQLKVEPEGVTIYKNRDYYLHSQDGNLDVTDNVKLEIPKDAVPDSEIIEVSIMGDILGSTISNIDKLVRMPYGCGEQNMVNFVPNILVLRYLETLQQLNPAIEEKAKSYLQIGYQRELTYKHFDGSYSAFGPSDASGSTWLTAYVVRSFHQAKKYIDVDDKILADGLEFLSKKQEPNGRFKECGKLFDYAHHDELGLSAFVLLAFIENAEMLENYRHVVERGYDFVLKKASESDDLYSLAIAIHSLQTLKLDVVDELLMKIKAKAQLDDGFQWWSKTKKNEKPDSCCWWSRPRSNDVEITAYILMTLLHKDESVLPVMKWLIAQRNSNGGFNSTQETVVGLQALINFAEKYCSGNSNMSIDVNAVDCNVEGKKFNVNKESNLVVQTLELPKKTREIKFHGKGTGTAILQIAYRYNIVEKIKKPSFKLNSKIQPNANPGKLILDVILEYVPPDSDDNKESNMVVMEVSLPSGYTAVTGAFNHIKDVEGVKRVETKNGDSCVIVYFESIKVGESKVVTVEAERSHDVSGQKPVPIVVYDYYDNSKRETHFYELAVIE